MQKKVLSLDGGGSWALLQAMALKEIYKTTPVGTKCRNILNEFDIVSANSGGSLMLAAMIEKSEQDIDEVISLFKNENLRKKIFSRLKPWERNIPELIAKIAGVGPKYKAARKIDGLKEGLVSSGHIKMCDIRAEAGIQPHLVICGFDYDLSRAIFFKTDQKDKNYTLADAVNASSNAPVNYFDEPVRFFYDSETQHQFWDGAVGGNNNPVLIGITEALRIFEGIPRTCENIIVLSIGTGNNLLPVEGFSASGLAEHPALLKPIAKSALSTDVKKMATSILSEPPEAATFMAHMLLGGTEKENSKPCIIRMNALIQPELKEGKWMFPEGFSSEEQKHFLDLIDLDMDAVEQREVLKIENLGKWWAQDIVVNQSIRYDGKTLRCRIGHDRFSKAKEEWLSRSLLNFKIVEDSNMVIN